MFFDDYDPKHCDSYDIGKMNLTLSKGFDMDEYVNSGNYAPKFDPLKIKANCPPVRYIVFLYYRYTDFGRRSEKTV